MSENRIREYSDYKPLIEGLCRQQKNGLIDKVIKSMNEHFIKLRDSERDEVRAFYPDKTAEEMFLINEKNEDKV